MQKIDNWDDHWRQYDETLAKSPAQFYRFDQVAKEVRRIIDTSPASSLLDVGCGQGVLLQTLKKTFPSLIFGGIEYSEYGVSLTKEKMPDSQIIQGDLILNTGSLQHFSSWADIITCSEVLEHVDDPCIFLKNCLPLLKSDGRIIITVPGGPMTAFDKSIGHRQHFNHEKLNLLLKEAGYTIICNRQAGFPWHNLYRLVLLQRKEKLAVETSNGGTELVHAGMDLFSFLFKLNLDRTPFGWQNVVTAKKTRSA